MEKQEETIGQVDSNSQSQPDREKNVNASNKKHEVSVVNSNSINNINFLDAKQVAAAEVVLAKLMRSKKSGIERVEDGLAVLMRAQDLNLPFSTCLEHIHVINGKTGIDIHVVKALLLKAGCIWECIRDYQPLYEYTDGINVYIDNSFPDYVVKCISQKEAEEKVAASGDNVDNVYVYPVKWYQDFNGNLYKDYQLNTNKFGIAINKQQANVIANNGKIPVYRVANKPVDYITEYKLTRFINGKEITAIGKFTYSDAIQADMFEKDTYKKYPRILIGHRAFTLAARDIASDILMGVMETTELKIVAGKELSTDDVSVEDAEIIELK